MILFHRIRRYIAACALLLLRHRERAHRGYTRRISHGGACGFRSHIARHPDIGLTIVILSNRSDFEPDGYIDRIADIYLEALDGRPKPHA